MLRGASGVKPIPGVSIDSRTLQPGEMFVAIPGERFDGHRFIPRALEKGASLIVAQADSAPQLPQDIPLLLVEDTIRFLGQLAGWYRRQFAIPVLALTGSAGKTTTKEMISAILSTSYRVMSTLGNLNNFIGVPLTLFRLEEDTEIAVVEMGTNHPGEIATLTSIVQPTHALITNIGSGHIGFFGSREAIYKEKTALFRGLAAGSTIFLNMEDAYLRRYQRPDVRIVRVGTGPEADIRGELLGLDEQGRVEMRVQGGSPMRLSLPGKHQFYNALLAAAVGLERGVPPEDIRHALENMKPVHLRMDVFRTERGITIINDAYNANPESMRAAIDYLCELPLQDGARRFAVLGDMLELGDQAIPAHRELGEYLRSRPVQVLGYGEMTREMLPILGEERMQWFREHRELARVLKKQLQEGDTVLIKGSRGMTMEKVLEYLDERR